MRKTAGEQGLVSTAEAREITANHMVCQIEEWTIGRGARDDRTEQSLFCETNVEDDYGMAIQGLWFRGCFSFGKRTLRQKLTLTLERCNKKLKIQERVVQLDIRIPVNKKGGKNDQNWPHIHFGNVKTMLDVNEKAKRIDIPQAIKTFEEKANLSFVPELPDPNILVLKNDPFS